MSCLIWGLVVLLSTQAHNFAEAMAVRVALGMMEAVVTPGLNCTATSHAFMTWVLTSSDDRFLVHQDRDPEQADTLVLSPWSRGKWTL